MPKKPKPSNQPFTPRGAELGPLPMPTEEELVAELMADAEDAGSLWDETVPAYAGLLDAGVNEVTRQALACHPLAPLVLTLFLERAPQDATTVASRLWNGRRFASYRVVANDILEDMERAGLLRKSEAGWYWLVTSKDNGHEPGDEG